jgi:hypothetical protein
VIAADTGDAWSIGDGSDAGCTVSAPASSLYLYLWNRASAGAADITVTGDPALLASWQSSVRIRWS